MYGTFAMVPTSHKLPQFADMYKTNGLCIWRNDWCREAGRLHMNETSPSQHHLLALYTSLVMMDGNGNDRCVSKWTTTESCCYNIATQYCALQWRHNGRDGVSNHQHHDCSLKRLFRRRSKKTSKLRVTGVCEGPAQRASDAEDVSIWWRHHDIKITKYCLKSSKFRTWFYSPVECRTRNCLCWNLLQSGPVITRSNLARYLIQHGNHHDGI